MWPDSEVDIVQVEKEPSGKSAKSTGSQLKSLVLTSSQVDKTEREQNPEWLQPTPDTNLNWQNIMCTGFQVHKIQADKHTGGQTPKKTEQKVSRIQSWKNQ